MFMGGVVGSIMREFALTLSAAVLVSVCLSLTLTPMLCGAFLKAPEAAQELAFIKGLETGFHELERSYARGLDVVLRHKVADRWWCSAARWRWRRCSTSPRRTGFFPQQDTGFLRARWSRRRTPPTPTPTRRRRRRSRSSRQDPDVDEAHYNVGGNPPRLEPQRRPALARRRPHGHRRTRSSTGCAPSSPQVVGAQVDPAGPAGHHHRRPLGRAQYQYTLSDGDLDELNEWAPKMLQALEKEKDSATERGDEQYPAR